MRDGLERHPVPPVPTAAPVPAPHRPAQNRTRQPSYSQSQSHDNSCDSGDDDEPWMRGTFLFRTPMTSGSGAGRWIGAQ